MAERDPPPPIPTSPPPTPPAEAPDPQGSAHPADPQPVRTSYIVQVPKDQIYRVPPPENAYLAERYRKPQERRRRCCCCCLSSWCFGAVVLAGLLFLAGAAAFYFLVRPPSPSFSVQHLRVERHHAAAARYAVDVGVRNAASAMGWFSLGGGTAVLSYSGSSVASGKMPSFYHGPKGQRTITLDLSGAGSAQLPAEVKKRMKGKRPKGGDITLSLTMVFPVKRKLGILGGTSTAVARVSCSVKVNTLAEGTAKVLEQSCKYSEV